MNGIRIRKRLVFSHKLSLALDRVQKRLEEARSHDAQVLYRWQKLKLERMLPR